MNNWSNTNRVRAGLAAPLAGRVQVRSLLKKFPKGMRKSIASFHHQFARRAPQAGRLNESERQHGLVALLVLAITSLLLLPSSVQAEHFRYDLTIDNGREKAHGFADDDPPAMGRKPREVIHVKKGEPLVFQFFMNSNFPHDTIKKVGVLYYIVPAEKVGQTTLPPRGDDAVLQGHFTMDFKPDTGRVGVRQQFHIDKPGVYLARVESENSASDHEHFAAIDIVVE